MTKHDRNDACQKVGADRGCLGLPLDEVRRIDALLFGE